MATDGRYSRGPRSAGRTEDATDSSVPRRGPGPVGADGRRLRLLGPGTAALRREAREAVLARARDGLHGAGGGVGLRSRERGGVLPRLAGHAVARRRRLRRRGELCLPEEAADAGGAARARRSTVGQPAPRDRRERHRLRPAAVLLGARPLRPCRPGGRRSRAGRSRVSEAARRRARLPARRARPARPGAAARLDPRHRPHGRPAEVPGQGPALHGRRSGATAGRPSGRR